MFITPNTRIIDQWREKQNGLQQLNDIANSLISAPTQKRDNLEKKYLDFIYSYTFDSLFGGLIVKKDELYYKSIITNLYWCELLINAGHTFCHGDILFVGKQILINLIQQLSNGQNETIKSERYFELNGLPNFFLEEDLKKVLNKKELALLSALTSTKNSDILFSYNCSLNEAAQEAKIHHKEAQIIEFNLKAKLQKIDNQKNIFVENKITNHFDFNCEVIISFANISNTLHTDEIFHIAKNLFMTLCMLTKNRTLNRSSHISLLYSALRLMEIEPDKDLSSKINELVFKLPNISNEKTLDERIVIQKRYIHKFLNISTSTNYQK